MQQYKASIIKKTKTGSPLYQPNKMGTKYCFLRSQFTNWIAMTKMKNPQHLESTNSKKNRGH